MWRVDLEFLRSFFDERHSVDWLGGEYDLEPDVDIEREDEAISAAGLEMEGVVRVPRFRENTFVRFAITREGVLMSRHRKVFLSHKGKNKPDVREFAETLRALGFDPWLDEDAMPAGQELERALLKGMKESCAAVFFITPDFKDEKYLAAEINYAIAEARERPEQFRIIPLLFKDENGNQGDIPDLLKTYKCVEPSGDLDALRAILKALPLAVGPVEWRE